MFPELRSTILLALGMAWTAVAAAEFLGAQTGLGQIIAFSKIFGYVDRMFLVALILLAYAALTYAIFERASRRLTEWMPRETVAPETVVMVRNDDRREAAPTVLRDRLAQERGGA
jgi:ABC-type nitrate/sulfonate/bicarbonate transport system permease component